MIWQRGLHGGGVSLDTTLTHRTRGGRTGNPVGDVKWVNRCGSKGGGDAKNQNANHNLASIALRHERVKPFPPALGATVICSREFFFLRNVKSCFDKLFSLLCILLAVPTPAPPRLPRMMNDLYDVSWKRVEIDNLVCFLQL